MSYKRRAEEMSSRNASSVSNSQQWRNELLMRPSEPVPINIQDLFKEPAQQKYLNQRGIFLQLGQQGQQGQHGQHGLASQHGQQGQMGQLGQHDQHGQSAQHGQNGQIGQHDQGNLGQQGTQGQQGFSGQQSLSGQSGLSGQNVLGQNSFSAQQALLCQHGHPLLVGQPGQSGVQGQPGQVLASAAVCCDQANCDKVKIEQLPEQYFQEPATPFSLMNPADGCDPQSGKKDPSEQYMYCPCGLSRGQLITICCTGRDCDNSTKIDEVPMGPPEEKRAKTTFNQNHYKY